MRTAVFLLSLTLLLASCRGPAAGDAGPDPAATQASADGVAMRVEAPTDPAVGPATVDVYLLEDGQGVEGAAVEVTGTMTHAGMTPVIREATAAEAGLYRADDFEFTMAGDWILFADATLEDGRTLRAETTVTARQP